MLQSEKKRGIDCSLIDKVRKRILEILQDNNEVDTCDVSRLEKDDSLIICFIVQYFDNHDTRDDRKETEGIERVCKHLLETLKWRKEIGINQLKVTDFPTATLAWNVGLIAKETVQDNTKVIVWRANKYEKSNTDTSQMAFKFWLLVVEKFLFQYFSQGYNVVVVHDMRGYKISNFDFNLSYQSMSLIQTHYPCLLKSTYVFEVPFLMKPAMKLILSALGSSFLKGFKILDFETCVTEFGGIQYVPTILGGKNPIEGLIPLPDETVTVRELGPKLGLNEKQIQECEVYIAQTSKKMQLEDHLFA